MGTWPCYPFNTDFNGTLQMKYGKRRLSIYLPVHGKTFYTKINPRGLNKEGFYVIIS